MKNSNICSLKGKQGPRVCLFKHIFVFLIFKGDLPKKKKCTYMYLKAVLAFNSSQLSLFSGYENGRAQVYDNVGFYCHFNGIPLQKLRDIQICRGRFKSLKT